MKKIFTTLFAGLMISAQVMAVSVKDVCGQFNGDLNIGGDAYPSRSIYLLPGVVDSTVTFVLPDFTFGKGKLGNIVLPNIPMDANGMLHLENATLYLDSIHERASITVINGLQDEGVTYNSVISANDAMVLLSIEAPASLPEPIFVLFMGEAVRANNYVLNNGGFEGGWVNNEPTGWHSFGTATGNMKDFVLDHTYQFIQSTDVRPGSKGANSAMLSSEMLLGVKANGNCTNGQINAGSTTADDASNNYNFSDPANEGFNTPFQGHPDSLVFWAKYLPADRDAANEVNKARASVIITTNDRYQDPEGDKDYSSVVLAKAVVNYAATSDMGWQRISVPFEYTAAALENAPAYILSTFNTNMLPGGGTSYNSGSNLSPKWVLDSLYLDDVEMIYNKRISMLSRNGTPLILDGKKFVVQEAYCDSCSSFNALTDGISAQYFVAFDAVHKCVLVYVIADDFAQSRDFTMYRVEYMDSDMEGIGDYSYTILCDSQQGTVNSTNSGIGLLTISATPNTGYHFTQWSDGNTDNPRSIVLTKDTTFTAEFAKNTYSISTESGNIDWGTTVGDTTALYLDEIKISAESNYGYHFVRWNDGDTANPRTITVTQNKTYQAIFAKNEYSITKNAVHGSIDGGPSAEYLDEVTMTVIPDYGYHFTQWSDSVTDNPRIIVLTQDTTFTAEFAVDTTGTCGDDNLLTWEFAADTKTLTISGEGTLNSNYTFGLEAPSNIQALLIQNGVTSLGNSAFANEENIVSLSLPNGLTAIGDSTFINCKKLKKLTIPSSVTTIGKNAFANGNRLETIILGEGIETIDVNAFANCPYILSVYAYMEYPPVIDASVFAGCGALSYVDLYVLEDSYARYRKTAVWNSFNLKTFNPTSVEQVPSDQVQCTKVLRDGQIFILRGEKVYNAQGAMVK